MKIRTDFVTNSSSSSFGITVGVELTNGKFISYSADGIDNGGGVTSPNPELLLNVADCKKAKNLNDLLGLLLNAVEPAGGRNEEEQADLDNFANELKESAKSLDDIRKVVITEQSEASGEFTSEDLLAEYTMLTNWIREKYSGMDISDPSAQESLLSEVASDLKSSSFQNNDPAEFLNMCIYSTEDTAWQDFTSYSWQKVSHIFDMSTKTADECRKAGSGQMSG